MNRSDQLTSGELHLLITGMEVPIGDRSFAARTIEESEKHRRPVIGGAESAAGEALAIFPPTVPRFWFATPPVQLAAMHKSGNSERKIGCSRIVV